MKNRKTLCFFIAALFLLSFTLPVKSIYSIQVKNIDGETVNMSSYQGKKILFIILSGKETDSSLNQLSSFYSTYKDSAAIVGILSLEDGYSEDSKEAVKKLFKDKNIVLNLTAGMYTRKASAGQSELMQWLTDKNQNMHFEQEVRGAGHKFFVDEAGELYAVIGPQASLSHPIFQRIMSRHPDR